MKKFIFCAVTAVALLCLPAVAAEKQKTCCEKARGQKKECAHKCCIKAHKEGKSCTPCNPNKEDLKGLGKDGDKR